MANLYEMSIDFYEKIKDLLIDESKNLYQSHIILQQTYQYFGNLALYNIYQSAYYMFHRFVYLK